jgi:lysophospholipase L1-like esterase
MTNIAADPARARRARLIVVVLLLVLGLVAACGGKDKGSDAKTPPTAAAAAPAGYVVVGDSFSAGSGTPPYDISEPCFASSHGYPATVAELDADLTAPVVRACGGATVAQVLATQLPAQPDPSVGLVTFTIGGNDAGTPAMILACATGDCVGQADGPVLAAAVEKLGNDLVDQLYPALRAAYPKAHLVQIGYPRLTSTAEGAACPWLDAKEQPEPGRITDTLNLALHRAADRFGHVEFVDVGSLFAGHELCTELPYVLGAEAGVGALHPTERGYVEIGRAVAAAIR